MLEQLPTILQEHAACSHQVFACVATHEERATYKCQPIQASQRRQYNINRRVTPNVVNCEPNTGSFDPGGTVSARNYLNGPSWVPATVIAQTGPVSYIV